MVPEEVVLAAVMRVRDSLPSTAMAAAEQGGVKEEEEEAQVQETKTLQQEADEEEKPVPATETAPPAGAPLPAPAQPAAASLTAPEASDSAEPEQEAAAADPQQQLLEERRRRARLLVRRQFAASGPGPFMRAHDAPPPLETAGQVPSGSQGPRGAAAAGQFCPVAQAGLPGI